ncbi:hypothetical protein [Sinorhizobium meliloti]|nr:hypothetical protein [Sinorhizobium meliloti]MDW9589647.1 hypothetical protein [Sinorhizobium meliloti]MDW9713542.1 hypothetical protein [Sinorhizobium meliloti]MDW9750623.1 hypothetical protein [Sinorhizobium meliloti]MDX0252295.1 hypothetical protein [Sinorhizobium meliloti]MDX0359609.1 hypothetical protein [Sinorhizobium meliloti]
MSQSLTMQARIDAYLAERRRLGFSLESSGIMLRSSLASPICPAIAAR